MQCAYCGRESDSQANYCSNCGYALKDKRFAGNLLKRLTVWAAPGAVTVISVFWLTGFYAFQIKTSLDIDNLCEQAETLGLNGKIDDALKVINKGLAVKPRNIALNNDKIMLMNGKSAMNHLNLADNYTNNNNYEQADNELELAKGYISSLKGPFYNELDKLVSEKKASVAVLKAKGEMNSNKNIDDLAVLLSEIEEYDTDDAREVSSELRRYIGNIAYDSANECLKVKDFTGALDKVNEGLAYDMSNDKLRSFKNTISEEKTTFEKIEKESMEQAMEAAAKEDDFNRTEALNLVESNGIFSSSGDFIVSGKVKNNAAKDVSMAKIFYGIYDVRGNKILYNSTYVYPNYIKPGETGEFENTEYNMPQGCYVKVIKMTWYIK